MTDHDQYSSTKRMRDEPSKPPEQPGNSKPGCRSCDACRQTLPQHLFPKKKFSKERSDNTCRRCRKNRTAERCKQPAREQIRLGRKGASGAARRPNNFGYCSYLDRLFSLECFPDIVALKAFTSAKDVSESMGAIEAACRHGVLKDEKRGKNVLCLCIGDGSTPRTAVLACFLKKWTCISIDPALQNEWRGVHPKRVRGLTGFGGMLEDFMVQGIEGNVKTSVEKYDRLILLCVHSHARLIGNATVSNIMASFNNIPTTLVSLPCCPKYRSQRDVGRTPDMEYEDDCIFSACRRVEVWNFPHS
ncbi:hypothetical protein ACHAWF_016757 [Thalassiosira exigua]